MLMLQRTSFKGPKAGLIIGLTAAVLGGCSGRNICDLPPVRYPVDGHPQHIFADPVGYRYGKFVPYRSPVTNEPLLRDLRPNYPINGPAARPTTGPAIGPATGNGGPANPATPASPTTTPTPPAGRTNLVPPTPVKPQAGLRRTGQRGPVVQAPAAWAPVTAIAAPPAQLVAEPAPQTGGVIEARPTIEARRGTTN